MIVVCGGGTGGHLSVAKALCQELNKRNIYPIFIGSINGQDKKYFENYKGFSKTFFLESSGIVNKKGFKKISSLYKIIKLSFHCKKILKQENIKAIISVGGYSAAPASFAAILSFKKLFIHEQNSKIGYLNSILKPFCSNFFSFYNEPSVAYPVDIKFIKTQRKRENLKQILFLGGSNGAKDINEIALKIAKELDTRGIKIIHQCGEKFIDEIKNKYDHLKIKADIFGFCNNIEEKMQQSDMAISRAGASTIAELCANNLPAIFLPYPFASKNHQYYNAKFLKDKNLCKIANKNDDILNLILSYDLKNYSENLSYLPKENGAKDIIDNILSQIL